MNTPPDKIHTSSISVVERGKSRIEWLDTLRLIACFLVVLTHSAMPSTSEYGIYLALLSFMGSPSSELFLSLSGAVLLPVKKDFISFYKRRFLKLIPPLFFWSIICLVVYVCIGKMSISTAFIAFLKIPFGPVVGVYWFVYSMIGLYLFAPFISYWLRSASRTQVEFFLCLWLINMLLPYSNLLCPNFFTATNGNHYWMLNMFAGFLGYWLLGYYLRHYPIKFGVNLRCVMVILGAIGYVSIIFILKIKGISVAPYVDNLQIGSVCLVALIYTLIQNFPVRNERINKVIRSVAMCSFGIYLTHILVAREFVWIFFSKLDIHPVLSTPIIAIITIAICWGIVKLFNLTKIGKKLVGL